MDTSTIQKRITRLKRCLYDLQSDPETQTRLKEEVKSLEAALPYLKNLEDGPMVTDRMVGRMLDKLRHDGMILYDRCDMKNFIESFKNKSL